MDRQRLIHASVGLPAVTVAVAITVAAPTTGSDTRCCETCRRGTAIERITTAVPWPRGLVFHGDRLLVLARGRHRRAGGPDPAIEDHAGTIFAVDPRIAEPVVAGRPAGRDVARNATLVARATEPPFHLWKKTTVPPSGDRMTDRPYCTLERDPVSGNLFVCGFSGIDLPDGGFRKNPTDAIHRFDPRSGRWYPVELHDPAAVDPSSLTHVVSNEYYPHHDPTRNPPPHGWLNGPDGLCVVGDYLYAAAKDNGLVVQYELTEIRQNPDAGPPRSRVVLGGDVKVRTGDAPPRTLRLAGHSALAARDGWLYVGLRTTSQVVRFPLEDDGDLTRPSVGQLVGQFDPWDPRLRRSADLMDMAFNAEGELFVVTARSGRVWRIDVDQPGAVFDGRQGTEQLPYVDLAAHTGNPRARCGNIAFDGAGNLYVCGSNYDSGTRTAGVIYRVVARRPRHRPESR